MKKLLAMMAVVAVAGAAFAQAPVTSDNAVGYTKETLNPGFNMVRTPFVEAGQAALDIQNIFDTSVLLQGSTAGTADQIFFWDPISTSYEAYFLHDGFGKGNLEKAGKWVDSTTTIAVEVVPPEAGFFFVRGAGPIQVVMVGEVVAPDANQLDLVTGFNLVANPYTSAWPLNDGSIDWIAAGAIAASTAGSADQIFFWDNAGTQYIPYFLHDGFGKGNLEKAGKWVDSTTAVDPALTVGINEGFFYVRAGADVTIPLTAPYTLD